MAESAKLLRRQRALGLGDRIAERRNALGLKQAQVVERLGKLGVLMSVATYSRYEWGKPTIEPHVLPALAMALECSVTFLLALTDNPAKWTPDRKPPAEQGTPAILGGSDTPGYLHRLPYTRVIRVTPERHAASLMQQLAGETGGEGGEPGSLAPVADLAARRQQRERGHGTGLYGQRAPLPG